MVKFVSNYAVFRGHKKAGLRHM